MSTQNEFEKLAADLEPLLREHGFSAVVLGLVEEAAASDGFDALMMDRAAGLLRSAAGVIARCEEKVARDAGVEVAPAPAVKVGDRVEVLVDLETREMVSGRVAAVRRAGVQGGGIIVDDGEPSLPAVWQVDPRFGGAWVSVYATPAAAEQVR
jgi:hypothetical protein